MPSRQTLPSSLQAPSLALLFAEPLRAILDAFGSHVAAHPERIGDGHPVIVYPGLGAGSMNTSQLRNFLHHAGFNAADWGAGVNIGHEGDFDDWLDGLAANVLAVQARNEGRKVSLIGWSLGGIFAREIAKRVPDAVRSVITLATPFSALRDASHAGAVYRLFNGDPERLSAGIVRRLVAAPPVPTTSIYSKSDGIVCWRGCIEKRSPTTESVEVDASHLGIINHPDALRIVANRLAQPEGHWKPLKRVERSGRHR